VARHREDRRRAHRELLDAGVPGPPAKQAPVALLGAEDEADRRPAEPLRDEVADLAVVPVAGLAPGEHELEAKLRRQVDEARDEGLDATFKLVTCAASGAAHMIRDVAREVEADVIIVGTRGHTPIVGLLLGSVTQRLLHIAPCPVLAVPAARQTGVDATEGEVAEAAR